MNFGVLFVHIGIFKIICPSNQKGNCINAMPWFTILINLIYWAILYHSISGTFKLLASRNIFSW